MKRKLLSALLFGAIIAASTSTFVSCKDYDDDISDLRSQITTNATTLKSLVEEKTNNAETEITALKAAQEKLDAAYKHADDSLGTVIKNATNDAEGYAAIQAAQAKTAAISAAKTLVDSAGTKLQKSIDDANDSIKAQGETVKGLLAADKVLTKGMTAAQARADEAYTLATEAKGDAAQVASDLKEINKTLTTQINLQGTKLKEVDSLANANAAAIEKQQAALIQLHKDDSTALKALSDEDITLRGLITSNATEIGKLWTAVNEAKTAAAKALTDADAYTDAEIIKAKAAIGEDITAKLTAVKSDYEAADAALKTAIINELQPQIKKNSDDIITINAKIATINALLAQLINGNVNNLVTSIIYQGNDGFQNVYAKVSNGTDVTFAAADTKKETAIFPYESFNGYSKLSVGSYNIQEYAGELYATVNPSDIDASKADIRLKNSLDQENASYKLGKATPANVLLTRSTSKNGLWTLPITSSITSSSLIPPTDKALYALTTSYKQDTVDANGNVKVITKNVYSHYAIQLNSNPASTVSASDLNMIGCGKTLDSHPATGVDIQFTALDGQLIMTTDNGRVYKKFVECTKVVNSKGETVSGGNTTFNKANAGKLYTILSADNSGNGDTINITCPEGFKNYKVFLKYYIWNYDGSIKTIEKIVVFNQNLWGPDNTSMTQIPTGATTQDVASSEFPTFSFIQGDKCSNNTTWSQEAYYVDATTTQSAISGATIALLSNDFNTTYANAKVGDSKQTLPQADLSKIKQMRLYYDPSMLTTDTEYKITLSFYDKNGFKVNIVNIKFTMKVPQQTENYYPKTWHIAAAFDTNDKLTIAWADYATADASNTIAKYAFSGSFFKVNDGYSRTGGDAYMFKLTDATTYAAGKANAAYIPNLPSHNTYVMSVPNKSVQYEHVYSMTAGIKFYGLANLISYDGNGGWADNFNIKFLSPIKYAIKGTKGYIDGKTYTGMTTRAISVDYRKSITVNDSYFTAIDPKEATSTPVHFFEGKDARVVNTSLDFAETNSNNALFSSIVANADGTYTLVTSDKVSMTGNTDVKFRLTVTDVWGVVTTYDFVVTVNANK